MAALVFGAAACGDSGGSSDGTLRVWAGAETPVKPNFNPYSPLALASSLGSIYEPLFIFGRQQGSEPVGLIGDSFAFSPDGKQLTVKIKPGLKWSDGTPLTAKDVAFSFNYEAKHPESVGLTSAAAPDDSTAVLTFARPQFAKKVVLLQFTPIVPEHIWSKITDFATFTNEKPVGSGAYVVDSVSSGSYTMVANKNYRDYDGLGVKKVQYIGINNNQSAQDLLSAGKLDWAGFFVPNPDSVTANGTIQYTNQAQDPTTLFTCSSAELGCTGPQTDPAVRQALNAAVDRTAIKDKAFSGLAKEVSPTMIVPTRDRAMIADPANLISPQKPNVAEAGRILESAGYVKGGDGFYAKGGVPLEIKLLSADGATDLVDTAKLVVTQAAAAGIKLTYSTAQPAQLTSLRQSGNFQLIVMNVAGTAVTDPYQVYSEWFGGLSFGSTSRVGTTPPAGRFNFVRYNNAVVDDALRAVQSTDDEATVKKQYGVIQTEIARDLPYIPLVLSPSLAFYNAKDYTGWVTKDNDYADAPPWTGMHAGYVLTQLKPKK
ncbi:ABC transporter substrate-binding protein [Tsukamurella strandjordii]|uniref:ABC transporter substrate-binding protein n=1 Tax=Tsukamurella strandjordii TaxID=147577 RepID=A0AA90NGQ4_9ACTN|nr:ABC transporter substrate-binding protein [Tsukamurella strandjordii]MDP0400077.1 ABC transporter substrate-binding protein [Tsukamurella strandjordii]